MFSFYGWTLILKQGLLHQVRQTTPQRSLCARLSCRTARSDVIEGLAAFGSIYLSKRSKEAAELALTQQRCGAPRRIRRGQIRLRVRDERCRDLSERVVPRGRQPGHFLCENAQCQACAAWRALQSDPLDPQRQHQRRCKSHKQGIQVPMLPTNRWLNMQKGFDLQAPWISWTAAFILAAQKVLVVTIASRSLHYWHECRL